MRIYLEYEILEKYELMYRVYNNWNGGKIQFLTIIFNTFINFLFNFFITRLTYRAKNCYPRHFIT